MIALTLPLRRTIEERCPGHAAQMEEMARGAGHDAIAFLQQAVQRGYLDRESAGEVAGVAVGRTHVSLARTLFQQDLIDRVPREFALAKRAIPLYSMGKVVTVAMADPQDREAIGGLEAMLDAPVSPVFSFPDEVESAIRVRYQSALQLDGLVASFDFRPFAGGQLTDQKLAELLESRQLVAMTDSIVLMALKERASDIHLESRKEELLMRFRIDGELMDRMALPRKLALPLLSRIKITSGMDITERRLPQDGRLTFPLPMKPIDIRVSSLPTMHGEKIVMRLLGSLFSGAALRLEMLDFSPEILDPLKAVIAQPNGILFVCGPTGCGKTTTLYAALNHINRPGVNVVTLEDPVEYEIPHINQVQIQEKLGRTFQVVLRSVLRQDPDVILVGEIRDRETARIATQAAMTGHLVLTTLHTSDAIQATTRLMDMGVERFMVAPSLIGVLNQRLVRRICEFCRTEHRPDHALLASLFRWPEAATPPAFFRGRGCERCGHTGFHGRVAIHEFLNISQSLRDGLLQQYNYHELASVARREGFRDMRYDGFKKALRGLTTIEEVLDATTEAAA